MHDGERRRGTEKQENGKRVEEKTQSSTVDEPGRDIEHKMNRKWAEKEKESLKSAMALRLKGKDKECPLMGDLWSLT